MVSDCDVVQSTILVLYFPLNGKRMQCNDEPLPLKSLIVVCTFVCFREFVFFSCECWSEIIMRQDCENADRLTSSQTIETISKKYFLFLSSLQFLSVFLMLVMQSRVVVSYFCKFHIRINVRRYPDFKFLLNKNVSVCLLSANAQNLFTFIYMVKRNPV